jgi:Na+-driven multidrug efflux pump
MSRLRRWFRDLSDAIRGTEQDYTQGSISRAMILLAVPMMLEMSMESIFAVVDVYFVASLGASAVATVGLTESMLTLIYAVGIGFSMGTTALVARRVGEKNMSGAADTAVQAILVGVVASIPFSVVGIIYAKDLLALMGGDAWAIEEGYKYTQWHYACSRCRTRSTSCWTPHSFAAGDRFRPWASRVPPSRPTSDARSA